jgi:hypothetical protein
VLFSTLVFSCSKDDHKDNKPIAKESYPLPGDTLFPEGIAYHQSKGRFYTGSVTSGDILEVNVKTAMYELLLQVVHRGEKLLPVLNSTTRGGFGYAAEPTIKFTCLMQMGA